jgi:malate permease and related proteins
MSPVTLHVTETVIAFTLMVMAAYLLKRTGTLKQEHSALFTKLLTQVILPATIFYQLWTYRLSSECLKPVLVMFLLGIVSLAISWLIGILLKFDRQSVGALMIVSSFGSSALIGYSIIQYAFANNPRALAQGIIISELGVGLPIFLFCPAVAMYFGGTFKGIADLGKLAKDYFLSPIFLSVVLGFVMSRFNVPEGTAFFDTIRETLKMVQGSLVVISAIILGLQLSFHPTGGFWKLITVSILIQMLFQPWFSDFFSGLLSVSAENRQILVLISALPAAILGPVFAARYDCATKTTTLLTFTHIAVSPVVVPAVFAFLT